MFCLLIKESDNEAHFQAIKDIIVYWVHGFTNNSWFCNEDTTQHKRTVDKRH